MQFKIEPEFIDDIISLSKEIETTDPIDWSGLNLDSDNVYRLMATNVLEHLLPKYSEQYYQELVISTIIKLLVENFVLNVRLRSGYGSSSVHM